MPDHLKRLMMAARRLAVHAVAALSFFLVLAPPHAAVAQVANCTISGPTLTLGTVNPYSTASTTTSGVVSYSCTDTDDTPTTLGICLSLGTGTGGTTAMDRTVASGASKLPIRITAGSTGDIGNGASGSYPMYGPIIFALPKRPASATGTIPLTVTVPPPASAPPPGSYSSSFTGINAQLIYARGINNPTCATLSSGSPLTAQTSISISATVATQCKVSATSMAFPTASVLATAVNATATVSTTCNAAVPVAISLDNGATGTGPTERKMKSGANAITYGIYRDAAATLPWGNTAGTNTASLSNGTGTLTAYGRVPAQGSPSPGSYTDVVNVIITY